MIYITVTLRVMLTNPQCKAEIKIQITIIVLLYHTQNKAFYSCPNTNEKLTNVSHLCTKLLGVSACFFLSFKIHKK
jgi:hypothetical protein